MIFNRNIFLSAVLIFSLAFNLAFVGISAYHLLVVKPGLHDTYPGEYPGDNDDDAARRTAPPHRRRMAELDLTDEQREVLQARREKLEIKLGEKRDEAREVRRKFIALLEDPDAEKKDIDQVAEEFHQIQQAMRRTIFNDILDLREVLDEEQRRRFAAMLMRRYIPSTDKNDGRGRFQPGREQDGK